ncbi:hypothetical protein RSOLAG1IB_12351 [Rhizoctonia solani AG-1 IB]|nr:hypothetical protein RSOLAG1IB_12351 [Rhizoctonia solani AG-1 IB]
MNMTEPWPKDGASFRASVSILRPLYEAMLSEIPLEMKEHVYQDWMQFHGIHGPRQVKTWSPITIVERANSYLSEVMQWGREYEGGLPFPEVSAGFVAQNGLELAVQQGILTVETDSDPDEPPTTPRPESMDTQTEFYPTTGHTYFALDEEFDVIPLICFLSEQYGKVICFLEGQGSLPSYQKLFHKITKRLVIFPSTINDKPAVEEAVVQFLTESTPVILLLAVNTKNLPAVLKQGSVDCCIYWGFSNPLKQAKKNRDLINCATSIVILMKSQEGSIKSSYGVTIHPSAGINLDRTKDSIMATTRNKTKSALLSTKGVVDSLYGSRLYVLGFSSRKKGAEETVRQLNRYAARALLHGEPEDGSEIFPPVAGRPKAYKKLVEKFDLQAAVDAGLLRLK